MYVGALPEHISLLAALDSIGENVIIADESYNVAWMNSSAASLFQKIAPLYGYSKVHELIGLNMGKFHKNPSYQENIMGKLSRYHRARINIKDRFLADIVITPIKDTNEKVVGYVVMLMDVTSKAEEEKKKDRLISTLSVPILNIWKKTIAVPLIGEFDIERANKSLTSIVTECASAHIEYALVDVSGIATYDDIVGNHIQSLYNTLLLIGTNCIIVGITAELAMSIQSLSIKIPTFGTAYAGLQYIISQQQQ
ncbi:RsbR, positive regulator of sigma-B [Peribacillus sp. SCS-155]|uniref:RsbR, positive regulator of sigma-B n=1 Tax=Peribacillus sedimenti TaxID=3115297 RepID=UPI00390644F8